MKIEKIDGDNEGVYKSIFETCEEGIIIADKLGVIHMANTSVHNTFGFVGKEMIGMNIDELVPSDISKHHHSHRKNYHQTPSPRKMGVGRDLLAQRKNGETFPVEISLNLVHIDNEEFAMAFIIDITDRKNIEKALKKSEEQLIQYATELENRVEKRTFQLDQVVKSLEKTNNNLAVQIEVRKNAEERVKKALEREKELGELKSRFVSMASHEFRTPLSTILSSASLITKYKTEEGDVKRVRHVNKIKAAIENLNHILNDFLSISKLEEGKVKLNIESVTLLPFINDIFEELLTFKKEGQEIEYKRTGVIRNINTDPKILKNVLINLISNALKYSDKHQKVFIATEYKEKSISIAIRDEGMGISVEDQEHLFERFFRAKGVTNIQGTGLGLNIVKKYIEELKGNITFKSEFNVGSTFTINLPDLKE